MKRFGLVLLLMAVLAISSAPSRVHAGDGVIEIPRSTANDGVIEIPAASSDEGVIEIPLALGVVQIVLTLF